MTFNRSSFTTLTPFSYSVHRGTVLYKAHLVNDQCLVELVERHFQVSNFEARISLVATYNHISWVR